MRREKTIGWREARDAPTSPSTAHSSRLPRLPVAVRVAQPRLRWRARAGCAARGGAGSAGRAARPSRALQPARSRYALLRGGVARGLAVRAPPVQRPLADHAPLRTLRLAHESLTPGAVLPDGAPSGPAGARGPAPPRRSWLASQCRGGGARRTSVTYGQFRFWNVVVTGRVDESRTRDFPSTNDVERAAHAGVETTQFIIAGCCWLSVGEETGAVSATAARKRLVQLSRKARFDARSTRVRLVGHVAARSLAPHHVGAHDPGVSGTSPSPPFPVARHPDVADASSTNVDPSPRPPPTLRTSRPSPRTCSCVHIPNPARRGCRPSWRRS